MNKRFIWNIEINNDEILSLKNLTDERDELRWEARYFFNEDEIITLFGLDNQFLLLSNYQVKHREDSYVLLADNHYNIKHRRQEILYKPLLQKEAPAVGYGKKINLKEYPEQEILPGTKNLTPAMLLAHIQHNPKEIGVIKDALIYKFPGTPTIKLELARLAINTRIYYSICVEGHSRTLVKRLAKHIVGKKSSCDYVSFLKQTQK